MSGSELVAITLDPPAGSLLSGKDFPNNVSKRFLEGVEHCKLVHCMEIKTVYVVT